MTDSEFDIASQKASSFLNISVFNADTDIKAFREACVYGPKYNRGLSETFYDVSEDVNHPAKQSLFIRELCAAKISIHPWCR